jgi:hypothetical protein
MIFSRLTVNVVVLVWFLGWGFLSLRFPTLSCRLLSWGRKPTPKQLKRVRALGYMGVGFGSLYLVELAAGLVPLR